jgi:hypothetical protein
MVQIQHDNKVPERRGEISALIAGLASISGGDVGAFSSCSSGSAMAKFKSRSIHPKTMLTVKKKDAIGTYLVLLNRLH